MRETMDPTVVKCIEDCSTCFRACMETIHHCLTMGGKHAEVNHIVTLMDCAEMCKASESFMVRMSMSMGAVCAMCADVCDRCADQCERIDPNDEHMKHCAEMCRQCAESCRSMQM